ncbi:brambleberry-like, partial [Cordylochernes scorpioides]
MVLKGSCSGLTEEDIGKLSVQLLNCQSAVEGRPIHPCRPSMTLKECTRNMDQHTWNAYHIVSNRARAVCYATRQLQFSLKTEMTVNRLSATAQNQLEVLKELEEGQGRLSRMTDETLDMMSTRQKEMLDRQERLKFTTQTMQTYVASNLRDLAMEKSLITMGNKELSNMTKAIKTKLGQTSSLTIEHFLNCYLLCFLPITPIFKCRWSTAPDISHCTIDPILAVADEASCMLGRQTLERQQDHQALVKELGRLQDQARLLYAKLEAGTRLAQTQLSAARLQHQEALLGLSQINDTVGFMLRALGETRAELLAWAAQSGLQISTLVSYLQHLGFGLLAALAAAFIQAPALPRIAILLLLSLNCYLSLEVPESAMDFSSLSLALFSVYI